MKFNLKIDSENDACQTREDLNWMLNKVRRDVENGKSEGNIQDMNGLKVGSWSLELEEEDEEEETEEEDKEE